MSQPKAYTAAEAMCALRVQWFRLLAEMARTLRVRTLQDIFTNAEGRAEKDRLYWRAEVEQRDKGEA